MKSKMKLFCVIIISLFYAKYTSAQAEFFDTLNTTTAAYTQIEHLAEVNYINICPEYTTFDKTHHRYFFKGKDFLGVDKLYTVDAITGSIIYNPLFYTFSDPVDNIIELQYDNVSGKLYGLHWNNQDSIEYLVTVNPETGTFTIIDSLPGVFMIMTNPHFIAIDEVHRFYIFVAYDFSYNQSIYFVNLDNGAIDHTVPFVVTPNGNPYFEMQYDNATQTMYALHQDATLNQYSLVSIDTYTGAMNIIDSIPGVQGVYTMPSYTTFDELRHRYIFCAVNNTNFSHLYSIDAATGAVICAPQFPPAYLNSGDNLVELEFDNSTGTLYCLIWDTKYFADFTSDRSLDTCFSVFPNPFSEVLHISFNKEYENIMLVMYDINGRVAKKQTFGNTSEIEFEKGDLPSGSYMMNIFSNRDFVGMKKVIVE